MSENMGTGDFGENAAPPSQPKGGKRRRLLLDTAKIGASVPVVMTISNRASAHGAKSPNGGKLSAGNSHAKKP